MIDVRKIDELVQRMIDNEGIYLCSGKDGASPFVIWSTRGTLTALEKGLILDPERFLDNLEVRGPLHPNRPFISAALSVQGMPEEPPRENIHSGTYIAARYYDKLRAHTVSLQAKINAAHPESRNSVEQGSVGAYICVADSPDAAAPSDRKQEAGLDELLEAYVDSLDGGDNSQPVAYRALRDHYDSILSQLAAKEEEIAGLREEVDQCHAKATCCCGDYMKDHNYSSGHSPLSMYDYALVNAERESAELRAKLAEAEKDAERYRWLRIRETGQGYQIHGGAMWASQETLDAAIDAAREAGK